jgi:hypothetical protein
MDVELLRLVIVNSDTVDRIRYVADDKTVWGGRVTVAQCVRSRYSPKERNVST